jgi:DNA topoisomerase-1
MDHAPDIIWTDDSGLGITREKREDGWAYFAPDGERIADEEVIARLNAIGLPPAYRDAWFNPNPNGHIQATGYDEKGRKQYRYHLGFREAQEAAKYERTAAFGRALPKLRAKVEADLKHRGLDKARAVAAVVRLLDLGQIRVGSEEYVKKNKSFGATTLRKKHAELRGSTLKLQFKAKSGKLRELRITDRSLAGVVKKCQDLRDQHLFAYLDDHGEAHPVSSSDVNDYIKRATGGDFTAKNFRTWGASLLAFESLCTAKEDLTLKSLLEPVVEKLGNTPAIARKSYVHPRLIDVVKEGQAEFRRALRLPRTSRYLSRTERGLIDFLEQEVVPALEDAAEEAQEAA